MVKESLLDDPPSLREASRRMSLPEFVKIAESLLQSVWAAPFSGTAGLEAADDRLSNWWEWFDDFYFERIAPSSRDRIELANCSRSVVSRFRELEAFAGRLFYIQEYRAQGISGNQGRYDLILREAEKEAAFRGLIRPRCPSPKEETG